MRRAFTLVELLVVIAIILILCGLLGGDAAALPFYFVFGWVLYLVRVIPKIQPAWDQVALFVLGVLAAVVLVRLLLRQSIASSVRLVGLTLLVFVAGTAFVGATHQVCWLFASKEPWIRPRWAIRTAVQNQLSQFGRAIHARMTDINRGEFPPGVVVDRHGVLLHGWPTLLLPYIEQEPVYRQIDLSRPWDDPANDAPTRQAIPLYQHPNRRNETIGGRPAMHFAANVHVLGGDRPRQLADFLDIGESNILLGSEVNANVNPWAYPVHLRDPELGPGHPSGFASGTPDGTIQILMLDGSVRSFHADTEGAAAFRALSGARP